MKKIILGILLTFSINIYASEAKSCINLNNNINITINNNKEKIESAISVFDEITYMNRFISETQKHLKECYNDTSNQRLKEILANAYDKYEETKSIGREGLLMRGQTTKDFGDNIANENFFSAFLSAGLNSEKVKQLNIKYKTTFKKANKLLLTAYKLIP